MNALMMAASLGFTSVVRRLLEEGADYTVKNKDGKTAYQLTKQRAVKDMIQEVIDAKAEAEKQAAIKQRGKLIIDFLFTDNMNELRKMIESNEYVEVYNISWEVTEDELVDTIRSNCPFRRPIEIAVYLRIPEAVEMLLEAGSDPDVIHMQVRNQSFFCIISIIVLDSIVILLTTQDHSTCVIRLSAEPRAPSYPTTAYSRDREIVRYKMLELLITIGKASVNAVRKVRKLSPL